MAAGAVVCCASTSAAAKDEIEPGRSYYRAKPRGHGPGMVLEAAADCPIRFRRRLFLLRPAAPPNSRRRCTRHSQKNIRDDAAFHSRGSQAAVLRIPCGNKGRLGSLTLTLLVAKSVAANLQSISTLQDLQLCGKAGDEHITEGANLHASTGNLDDGMLRQDV